MFVHRNPIWHFITGWRAAATPPMPVLSGSKARP